MRSQFIAALALAAWAFMPAPKAQAGAVLTSGTTQIGINDEGHLIFGGVGLTFTGVGDALTPGCFCEGWGVGGNGTANWASISNGGINGIVVSSFTSTATTATSVTTATGIPGLRITHSYQPSAVAPELFEAIVLLENTGAAVINDLRYARTMDWDVPPTAFSEFVTIQGLPAINLVFSNDNGFAVPDPYSTPFEIVGGTTNVNFTDVGPADHGAAFFFDFGSLAAGASATFKIFYGAAPTEVASLAALAAVGAEIYSFGQNSAPGGSTAGTPATYIFAFSGVGGSPVGVPEPASILLFGSALLGMAAMRKRVMI